MSLFPQMVMSNRSLKYTIFCFAIMILNFSFILKYHNFKEYMLQQVSKPYRFLIINVKWGKLVNFKKYFYVLIRTLGNMLNNHWYC